jgi:hypothetical protein
MPGKRRRTLATFPQRQRRSPEFLRIRRSALPGRSRETGPPSRRVAPLPIRARMAGADALNAGDPVPPHSSLVAADARTFNASPSQPRDDTRKRSSRPWPHTRAARSSPKGKAERPREHDPALASVRDRRSVRTLKMADLAAAHAFIECRARFVDRVANVGAPRPARARHQSIYGIACERASRLTRPH